MKKVRIAAPLTIALALISASAFAAPATTTQAKKPSLLSKIFHHGKTSTQASSNKMRGKTAGFGQIIGDKNTKVYHMPGDKYPLPAEKNRVYFRTEAQAIAAGYHRAGAKAAAAKGSKKTGAKMSHAKSAGKGHPMAHHKGAATAH